MPNMRTPETGRPCWAEPIEMLGACHDHFSEHLDTMLRLAERLPVFGVDADARREALDVLKHFSVTAANHHEDEERDLFPALLAAVPRTERPATQALIDRLLADHERMAELREPILARVFSISQGRPARLDVDEIEALATLYREHMRVETEQVMPLARRFLTAPMLCSLSVTMSVRRGFRLEDLPAAAMAASAAQSRTA